MGNSTRIGEKRGILRVNGMRLVYLNAISKEEIETLKDILKDSRLVRHLWIELILNPDMVRSCIPYIEDRVIHAALEKAVSWYIGFRWLLPENGEIERLYKKDIVTPYQIRGKLYRDDRREFLKGILHARLC